jgi:hypothetical protein
MIKAHNLKLPIQCAAMNMTNINPQLLTLEAAVTGKKEHIYHAAMLDPHTSAELSIDDIIYAESLATQVFGAMRLLMLRITALLESRHKNVLASKHFYL